MVVYLGDQEALIDMEKIRLAQKVFAAELEGVLEQVDAAEHDFITQPRSLSSEGGHTANFVSFNYTRVVDMVVQVLKEKDNGTIGKWTNKHGNSAPLKIGKIFHAHGYVDRWPVLGVCTEYLIANKELLLNEEFKTVVLKAAMFGQAILFFSLNCKRHSHMPEGDRNIECSPMTASTLFYKLCKSF